MAVVAVIFDEVLDVAGLIHRLPKVADEAAVDDGVADFGAVDDRGDLAGTEQWHGGDGDSAGFEHAKPNREHHMIIGAAEQDPASRDKLVVD